MSGIAENGMTIRETDGSDSRRLLAAVCAAVILHAALIAIPLLRSINAVPTGSAPIVVDFEAEAIQTQSVPATSQTVSVQPETVSAARAVPAARSESDFTIPTPKSSPQQQAAASTGQSFRESGNQTGASATTVPAGPAPNIPAAVGTPAQGSSSGAASSAPPARGEGVLVADRTKQPAGGSLDLGALDKALAGTKTGGQGSGQQGAKPQTAQTLRIGEPQIKWEKPDAALNRKPLYKLDPKLPEWVAASGLTFRLTISFTVSSDGIVSVPKIEITSGYADVDAAILEAFRRWRFNADSSSNPIKGVAPILIQ